MNNNPMIWKSPDTAELVAALLSIDDTQLMQAFLRDIMTEKEIIELSTRLKAAKMLINSVKYTDVVEATGMSSRTVARISDWIKKGNGGYRKVIFSLEAHHSHIPPARV